MGVSRNVSFDRHPVILTVSKEDNGKGAGLSTFRVTTAP